jgi:NAD(P)H-nitrite reductase large subunit
VSKKIDKKSFDKAYIVCTCKQVTLGEILYAIKEQGAVDLDDLEQFTEAGGSCGCCKSPQADFGEEKKELYLSEILDKFA